MARACVGAWVLLSFLLLFVLTARLEVVAAHASSSHQVVGLEARCTVLGPAETNGAMKGTGAPVFVVDNVVLNDGTLVAQSRSERMGFVHRGLAGVQSFASIGSSDCLRRLDLFVIVTTLPPCIELDDGVAMPRTLCIDICEDLWDVCAGPFTALVGVVPNIPTCGQQGMWLKYPEFAEDASAISRNLMVPEQLHVRGFLFALDEAGQLTTKTNKPHQQGTNFFADESPYTINGQDVACFPLAQIESTYNRISASQSGNISACEKPSCDSPLAMGELPDNGTCTSCDIACPLEAFDSFDFMRHADIYPALVSVPLLFLLLVLETGPTMRRRSTQPLSRTHTGSAVDPYLVLCCLCGLMHAGLVLGLMVPADSSTGCNARGAFTSKDPEMWASVDQARVCIAMRMSVHVLQLLLNSMACFMVHTLWKFEAAVSFGEQSSKPGRTLDTVFIVVLPVVCTISTLLWGGEKALFVYDDHFGFDSIRYLYKCGPVFHNVWIELAVVEAPMVLAIAATIAAAVGLRRLCTRIVSMAAHATKGKVSTNQVRHMQRMGAQMHFFSVGCAGLLLARTASTAYLRTRMQDFVHALEIYVSCAHTADIFDEVCADPKASSSGWEPVALATSILASSMIPPLFAAYFAGVIFLRYRSTTGHKSTSTSVAPAHH